MNLKDLDYKEFHGLIAVLFVTASKELMDDYSQREGEEESIAAIDLAYKRAKRIMKLIEEKR